MNSEKQLYEELLKEHPELKESKIDILEVITLMKQVNPDIVADADYRASLKERLDTIAQYNPQKSNGIFGFLKYFIPVFSFGFAVFGFVYFSDDFKSKSLIETGSIESIDVYQEESENIAPAAMMMLSDMADDSMLENNPESIEINSEPLALMKMSRGSDSSDISQKSLRGSNIESSNIQPDNIPEDLLEESMPMMFTMDSIMEDSQEIDENNESITIESMGLIEMQDEGEILDIFLGICGEYNGLIKVLEDGDRTCILENKNCLESTHIETECFNIK